MLSEDIENLAGTIHRCVEHGATLDASLLEPLASVLDDFVRRCRTLEGAPVPDALRGDPAALGDNVVLFRVPGLDGAPA